ncbi:diadenosine tetraphosphate hydrolase [Candidatus Woesearchaeota archaeon]|nr:diadenosine tetraphosphate hydrolase [Candidatus Woesearchaeota archaeon]
MKNILFADDIVLETDHFKVGQDWETPVPGFFIIAAKRKILSFDEFSDEEAEEFIKILRKLRKGMKEILKIDYVYFFQNEDTGDKLFHFWVFPRYEWMKKFGIKIESVRPIMDYAEENMAKKDVIKEVRDVVKKMRDYMEK